MESKTETPVTALKAHLAINVKNVEESIEFYRKMLSLEPSKIRPGYAKFDVQNPPLNLTLNQVAFNERGALSHLGIQLGSTADVLAVRQKWEEAGLAPRDEMQTNCCYATQDKTWVQDPDGNEWEAFVVLKDNLTESVACCGIDAGNAEETNMTTPVETTGKAETISCCATSNTPAAIGRSEDVARA